MSVCLNYLQSKEAIQEEHAMDEFRKYLSQGISSLANSLPEEMRSTARFSSRPLTAPCRNANCILEEGQQPPQCTLLTFCVVGTLDTQVPNPDFTFTPFRLFRVQQQVNDIVADCDGFSRELTDELFCADVRSGSPSESDIISITRSAISKFWPSRKLSAPINTRFSRQSFVSPIATFLGDITVQKEVRVDVTQLDESSVHEVSSTHDAVVAAGDALTTPATYVDELYRLCYAPGIRLRPDPAIY